MPVQIKSPLLPTSMTRFYTVPQNVYLSIYNIEIVNVTGMSRRFDIRIVPAGQTSGNEFEVISNIQATTSNDLFYINRYWCLNPGDSLEASATGADQIVLWFFGEYSPAPITNEGSKISTSNTANLPMSQSMRMRGGY